MTTWTKANTRSSPREQPWTSTGRIPTCFATSNRSSPNAAARAGTRAATARVPAAVVRSPRKRGCGIPPDELRMKKTEGEETADRWLTGIVEVQLPADYKIKNIEATERAKAKMLEGIHGGGDDAGMEHPHSRQAAFAASRAALRKEDDGGFQKAEASANLKLQRKEFATSFGKGFASKAKKPRH